MDQPQTIPEFLARYNPDGSHPVTEIEVATTSGASPFIIVRNGPYAMIINPLAFDDHLSVDLHPYVRDYAVTAAAFGMSAGQRVQFPEEGGTGTTSHGWPSARLVAVLVGEQANV